MSGPRRTLPAPADLVAAWWTWRHLRRCRRDLRSHGLRATVPAPPPLPASAIRGVRATLRRVDGTCLERSLVLQRWHAAHGNPVDVIVGVPRELGGAGVGRFGEAGRVAHAWLATETTPALQREYNQIHTIAPPPF